MSRDIGRSLTELPARADVALSEHHTPLQVITGQVRFAIDFAVGFGLLMLLVIFVRSLFGMVFREPATVSWCGTDHAMFNRSNNNDGIAANLCCPAARRPAGDIVLAVVLGLVLRRKLSPVLPIPARRRLAAGFLTVHRVKAVKPESVRPARCRRRE